MFALSENTCGCGRSARAIPDFVRSIRRRLPPSALIQDIGFFICFGCGKKGDVLDFIQEVENLTFYEALKLLADRNGIPMPAKRERNDPETALRAAIYELHEIAAAAFHGESVGAERGRSSGLSSKARAAHRWLPNSSDSD